LRFINFAHSEVFMVGAFAGMYLGRVAPTTSWFGGAAVMFGAMVASAVLGILIERLAYRPLRERSKLTVLITAIGVSLLLQNAGQILFGANPQPFPEIFPTRSFELGGLIVSSKDLIVLGLTLALLAALEFIVARTKIGTAMRAVAFNPQAAQLMGINLNVVISFTFGLGSALAAAGGVLWAYKFPKIDPLMGTMPGLTAFVAAVLGGIGNITGAALGALLIGVIETFLKGSRWSTWTEAVAFVLLILILLFRPAGLLGKLQAEKV
ncbi:MAG: branched-chain amino acid ABC transporter permease, partial [Verrucomicrobia bacterium]|nr:branched-chain amino acid ABC transporter permease [Verrucomicrobiota bacterium]